MADAAPLLPSVAVLAAFALAAGGGRLIATRCDRRRGVLMIVAALVLLGNAAIWTWPT